MIVLIVGMAVGSVIGFIGGWSAGELMREQLEDDNKRLLSHIKSANGEIRLLRDQNNKMHLAHYMRYKDGRR